MKLYKFRSKSGQQVALSEDETGANLPSSGAPWRKFGELSVERGQGPRIAASSDEIIDRIESDGVLIWPFKDVSGN